MVTIFYLTLCIFALLKLGFCQHEFNGCEPLQTKTYVCDNAAWSLKVEPLTRTGIGPAVYSLSKDGKPAWTKELPFTLREAVISARGTIAGYAYLKDKPLPITDVDFLSCHVIDSEGNERFSWSQDRRPWAPGSPNIPLGLGVVNIEDRGEILFRVLHAKEVEPGTFINAELWMFVSQRTFEFLRSIDPCGAKSGVHHNLVDVFLVPGLPFFIASRIVYPEGEQIGRFVLLDMDGAELWNSIKLERVEDNSPTAWDANDRGSWLKPLCGPGADPGKFWMSIGRETRVHCKVSSGGQVEIVRSERITKPGGAGTETRPNYTKMPKLLASFPVETKWVPGSLPERISLFDFSDEGDVGCIVEDGGLYFYLLSQKNEVKAWKKIDLGLASNWRPIDFKSWTDNRWLVLMQKVRGSEAPRLLVLSGAGEPQGDLNFDLRGAVRFVTHPDGSILILFDEHAPPRRQISKFDRNNKMVWTETLDRYGEDVAQLPGKGYAVLSSTYKSIDIISEDGKRFNRLDLPDADEAIDEECGGLAYPTILVCDDRGSIYIKNSALRHSVQRYGVDGKWKAALFPRAEDGRRIGYIRDFGIDANGKLWVTDGALCRLDSKGKVDRVLGTRPARGLVREVEWLMTDPSGKLVCFDLVHHVVAVFDQEGRQLLWFRLVSEGDDSIGDRWGEDVFIDFDGLLNISTRENCWVRFTIFGTSKGLLEGRSAREWVAAGSELLRLDPSGKVLQKLDKSVHGDGFWAITEIHVDCHRQIIARDGNKLHIFDPSGKPLGAIPCEQNLFTGDYCLSGDHVYFLEKLLDLVEVTDHSGRRVALFPGPEERPEGFISLSKIWADGRTGRLFVLAKDRIFVLEGLK